MSLPDRPGKNGFPCKNGPAILTKVPAYAKVLACALRMGHMPRAMHTCQKRVRIEKEWRGYHAKAKDTQGNSQTVPPDQERQSHAHARRPDALAPPSSSGRRTCRSCHCRSCRLRRRLRNRHRMRSRAMRTPPSWRSPICVSCRDSSSTTPPHVVDVSVFIRRGSTGCDRNLGMARVARIARLFLVREPIVRAVCLCRWAG